MPSDLKRKLAAIMFTDIAGYTALSSTDETKALKLLDKQEEILTPIIEKFNGTLHNRIGDGLLFTFPTVTDAVKCGIKIQKETKEVENLNLRIGIHEGEITLKNGDVLGDDVNVASRIDPFAAEGGIVISGKVQQNISSLPEFKTKFVAEPSLKGVRQNVKIFCIISHGLPKTDISKVKAKVEHNSFFFVKKILFPVTGFIFTLIGGAFWFIYPFISISIADEPYYDSSIAILYFQNRGSSENEFFVDGLTEELINRFSRINNLRVIPRMDVGLYKNKKATIDEISNNLDVDYILDGSVTIINEKIKVNLELLNTSNKDVLWAESYNKTISDIFTVQDDVAENITSNIDLIFSSENLLDVKKRSTDNLDAYRLYIKASNRPKGMSGPDERTRDIALLEEAIAIDSTYSDAYALLAGRVLDQFDDNKTYSSEDYVKQLNYAIHLTNKALYYNPNHELALGLSIFTPIILFQETSNYFGGETSTIQTAQAALTMRGVAQNIKTIAKEYPQSPFSKTVVGFYYWVRSNWPAISNNDDRSHANSLLEEAWEDVKIYKGAERGRFSMDILTYSFLSSILPQFYNSNGEFKKSVRVIKDNKCPDGKYGCLSLKELDDRIMLLYQAEDYEETLLAIEDMLNKDHEEFITEGIDLSLLKHSYYAAGRINIQMGNHKKGQNLLKKSLEFDINILRTNVIRSHMSDIYLKNHLGISYYHSGDYQMAVNTFDEIIKLLDEDMIEYQMQLISMIALSQMKMGEINLAKDKFNQVITWLESNPGINEKDNRYFSYSICYSLFKYFHSIGDNVKAKFNLEKAFNSAIRREKREYLEYNKSENNDKYELAKFFWVKDIVDDHKKYINNN